MTEIKTADAFIKRYDDGATRFRDLARGGNDQIEAAETRLQYDGMERTKSFVTDLSGLIDTEFDLAINAMTPGAINLYLHNKYPEFFRPLDDGKDHPIASFIEHSQYRIDPGDMMDGKINPYESKYNLNFEEIGRKLEAWPARDRALLLKIDLIEDKGARLKFKEVVLAPPINAPMNGALKCPKE